MPTSAWVATADIYIGAGAAYVLAYTPGNRVPDSAVTSLGLEASGLVQAVTINDDGTSPNWRGADPITRAELTAAVAEALAVIGTDAVTPSTIVRRDGSGGFGAAYVWSQSQPGNPEDLTRKDYVDSRIWKGTQAAYDAIVTKDPDVLYVIRP